jgi:hypothetical protein
VPAPGGVEAFGCPAGRAGAPFGEVRLPFERAPLAPGFDPVEEAVLSAAFELATPDFLLRCLAIAMAGTIHGLHDDPESGRPRKVAARVPVRSARGTLWPMPLRGAHRQHCRTARIPDLSAAIPRRASRPGSHRVPPRAAAPLRSASHRTQSNDPPAAPPISPVPVTALWPRSRAAHFAWIAPQGRAYSAA